MRAICLIVVRPPVTRATHEARSGELLARCDDQTFHRVREAIFSEGYSVLDLGRRRLTWWVAVSDGRDPHDVTALYANSDELEDQTPSPPLERLLERIQAALADSGVSVVELGVRPYDDRPPDI
jgi:hypothetical protein